MNGEPADQRLVCPAATSARYRTPGSSVRQRRPGPSNYHPCRCGARARPGKAAARAERLRPGRGRRAPTARRCSPASRRAPWSVFQFHSSRGSPRPGGAGACPASPGCPALHTPARHRPAVQARRTVKQLPRLGHRQVGFDEAPASLVDDLHAAIRTVAEHSNPSSRASVSSARPTYPGDVAIGLCGMLDSRIAASHHGASGHGTAPVPRRLKNAGRRPIDPGRSPAGSWPAGSAALFRCRNPGGVGRVDGGSRFGCPAPADQDLDEVLRGHARRHGVTASRHLADKRLRFRPSARRRGARRYRRAQEPLARRACPPGRATSCPGPRW